MKKLGSEAAHAFRELLVEIAAEAAKRALFR